MWQLNDPSLPTGNTGSALGRALFILGYYMPSTSVPPGHREEKTGRGAEAKAYPAIILPEAAISDHYPMPLPVPCDKGQIHRVPMGLLSRRRAVGSIKECFYVCLSMQI